jgi:hypothetical protein
MLREMLAVWAVASAVVLLCARRMGKSHLICAYLDFCARTCQGWTIVYASATQTGLRDFSGPIMDYVIRARGGTRPKWSTSDSAWLYEETGSRILLVGVDDKLKVDRIRGLAADIVVIDEAQIIKALRYVIGSVFGPMLLTTGGRLIVSGSGAFTAEDEWALVCAEANGEGRQVKRTIHDATPGYITPEALAHYAKLAGGVQSAAWAREMLCELAVEASQAVIPEWQDAVDDLAVDIVSPPSHALKYTVIDVGHVDMTVAALGYAWWDEGMPVITDEVVLQGATSGQIAQAIADAEFAVERRPGTPKGPRKRFADVTAQTAADLRVAGLAVVPFAKDDVLASVARTRSAVQYRRMRVHPRCVTICSHAESATWAPNRRDWRRVAPTETQRGHHFDGLAALRYFVDVADLKTDPYPAVLTPGQRAGLRPVPNQDRRVQALNALRRSAR